MSKGIINEIIESLTIVGEESPENFDGIELFDDGEYATRAEALLKIFEDKLRRGKYRMHYPKDIKDKMVLFQELNNSLESLVWLTKENKHDEAQVFGNWGDKLRAVLYELDLKIRNQIKGKIN